MIAFVCLRMFLFQMFRRRLVESSPAQRKNVPMAWIVRRHMTIFCKQVKQRLRKILSLPRSATQALRLPGHKPVTLLQTAPEARTRRWLVFNCLHTTDRSRSCPAEVASARQPHSDSGCPSRWGTTAFRRVLLHSDLSLRGGTGYPAPHCNLELGQWVSLGWPVRVQTPGYVPKVSKKTHWVFWVHPPKNPHFYFNLILVYTLYATNATNNAIFYCFKVLRL